MKEIPLTRGYVALVDDEDYERVSRLKWHVKQQGNNDTVYAAHTDPKTYKTIRLHRFVLDAQDHEVIDHRSGDGLDCTRSNLRRCTSAQNQQNRRKSKNSTASVMGISRSGNRWKAEIRANHKRIYLGSFDTQEAAGEAYRKASIEHHGEFSSFNRQTPKEQRGAWRE